ncbi:MAG: hypothetical protein D6728_05455 [Cyanobacteria bacterium J055]|nr:MAG: hypothetical protein D6728_05455 [Cyanobacteria bacterium J055]
MAAVPSTQDLTLPKKDLILPTCTVVWFEFPVEMMMTTMTMTMTILQAVVALFPNFTSLI